MNPYSGYGNVIFPPRFIGRDADVQRVQTRLYAGALALSIVGMPRVGKTSLVENVLKTLASDEIARPIYVALSDFEGDFAFASFLVEKAMVVADHFSIITPNRPKVFDNTRIALSYLNDVLCSIFIKNKIRLVYVIDEFDYVRRIEGGKSLIRLIRSIINRNYMCSVSFIFVSRRTLGEIEGDMEGVSRLSGVCEQLVLRPLPEECLKIFVDGGYHFITPPTDFELEKMLHLSGMTPFLCEMIMCKAVDCGCLTKGMEEALLEIEEYYIEVRNLMTRCGYWDHIKIGDSGEIIIGNHVIFNRIKAIGYMKLSKINSGYEFWAREFTKFVDKAKY